MPKRAAANSEPVAHGPMDMCLKKMKDHAAAGGVYTQIKIEPEVMVNAPRAPAPTRPPKKQPSASSKKAAKPDANVDEALATEPTRLETEPSRDDHDLEHLDAASWVANFVKNQKKEYNAFSVGWAGRARTRSRSGRRSRSAAQQLRQRRSFTRSQVPTSKGLRSSL